MLIAGSPAGMGNVGEIILADLIRHRGIDAFHSFAVVPTKYHWKPDPELGGLSLELLKCNRLIARPASVGKFAPLRSIFNYQVGFKRELERLCDTLVTKARLTPPKQILAVLNNAMMFALSHRVADALGLPLLTLVWDPPEYLLRQANFDRFSRARLIREFERSLSRSCRVAVVSEEMQSDYAAHTKAPMQLLRHGLRVEKARPASGEVKTDWLIGFAGSMYSTSAWRAFCRALDSVSWRVAGRQVRLRILGAGIELSSSSKACIEYLGFRSTDETQSLMADCDLCYLPQPFESHLSDLAHYSFPTKLTNYLALGRPVFVHAPPHASVVRFFAQRPFGVVCDSLQAANIVEALEGFLGSDATVRELASLSALDVAKTQFSIDRFTQAVDQFLGTSA